MKRGVNRSANKATPSGTRGLTPPVRLFAGARKEGRGSSKEIRMSRGFFETKVETIGRKPSNTPSGTPGLQPPFWTASYRNEEGGVLERDWNASGILLVSYSHLFPSLLISVVTVMSPFPSLLFHVLYLVEGVAPVGLSGFWVVYIETVKLL